MKNIDKQIADLKAQIAELERKKNMVKVKLTPEIIKSANEPLDEFYAQATLASGFLTARESKATYNSAISNEYWLLQGSVRDATIIDDDYLAIDGVVYARELFIETE